MTLLTFLTFILPDTIIDLLEVLDNYCLVKNALRLFDNRLSVLQMLVFLFYR